METIKTLKQIDTWLKVRTLLSQLLPGEKNITLNTGFVLACLSKDQFCLFNQVIGLLEHGPSLRLMSVRQLQQVSPGLSVAHLRWALEVLKHSDGSCGLPVVGKKMTVQSVNELLCVYLYCELKILKFLSSCLIDAAKSQESWQTQDQTFISFLKDYLSIAQWSVHDTFWDQLDAQSVYWSRERVESIVVIWRKLLNTVLGNRGVEVAIDSVHELEAANDSLASRAKMGFAV
jgi:hypothetical protein